MSELSTPNPPQNERESRTASWLRVIGTVVLLMLIFAGMVEVLARTGWLESSTLFALVELSHFSLYVVGGLTLGGLLVGIAALLRVLRDLHNSFTRVERFQYEQKDATNAADAERSARPGAKRNSDGDGDGATALAPWREIASLLSDLRDNSLLSEPERISKRVRVSNEEVEASTARIHGLIAECNFAQAREQADSLARRHPTDPRAAGLIGEVERARERHESEDVRGTARQVEDLISISAWSRARDLAQQLQQRHPDSRDARELLLKIEREHRVFEEEQQRRMSAEVQRYVTRRRWEAALAVAKAFIERFPGSEESEQLRMQLPTLEANAEIEIRQKLEAHFMDYVRHGRYIEALDLARRVIDQYPESPQAEVLRSQLERLEELADNPEAPPARVRVD